MYLSHTSMNHSLDNNLKQIIEDSYMSFTNEITPLNKINDNEYLLNYFMDQHMHLKI